MKSSPTLALLFAIGAAVCLPARAAEAQSSELRAEAKKLVEEGRQYQRNEQWDSAAEKYRAAYDLVPHPSLLFNLGQVHRLSGDEAKALQFYRKFVAVSASGELAEDAKKYITEIEGRLGALPFEDPLKEKVDEPVIEEPAVKEITVEPPANDAAPVAGSSGSGTLRIAGLATAGVGALLVGGGVYFGLRAKSLSDELSEVRMDAWTEAEIKKDKDGRAANRNMFIFSIAGGAAIATGAVLYVLGRRSGDRADTRAALVPSDGGGMQVVLSGSF